MSLGDRLGKLRSIIGTSHTEEGEHGINEWPVEKRRKVVEDLWPLVIPQQSDRPLTNAEESVIIKASSHTEEDDEKGSKEQESDKKEREKKAKDLTPLTDSNDAFVAYLEEQKNSIDNDCKEIERKRKTTLQKQFDLWDVYRDGLRTVSQLTDLRDAPDAVLPNNH